VLARREDALTVLLTKALLQRDATPMAVCERVEDEHCLLRMSDESDLASLDVLGRRLTKRGTGKERIRPIELRTVRRTPDSNIANTEGRDECPDFLHLGRSQRPREGRQNTVCVGLNERDRLPLVHVHTTRKPLRLAGVLAVRKSPGAQAVVANDVTNEHSGRLGRGIDLGGPKRVDVGSVTGASVGLEVALQVDLPLSSSKEGRRDVHVGQGRIVGVVPTATSEKPLEKRIGVGGLGAHPDEAEMRLGNALSSTKAPLHHHHSGGSRLVGEGEAPGESVVFRDGDVLVVAGVAKNREPEVSTDPPQLLLVLENASLVALVVGDTHDCVLSRDGLESTDEGLAVLADVPPRLDVAATQQLLDSDIPLTRRKADDGLVDATGVILSQESIAVKVLHRAHLRVGRGVNSEDVRAIAPEDGVALGRATEVKANRVKGTRERHMPRLVHMALVHHNEGPVKTQRGALRVLVKVAAEQDLDLPPETRVVRAYVDDDLLAQSPLRRPTEDVDVVNDATREEEGDDDLIGARLARLHLGPQERLVVTAHKRAKDSACGNQLVGEYGLRGRRRSVPRPEHLPVLQDCLGVHPYGM